MQDSSSIAATPGPCQRLKLLARTLARCQALRAEHDSVAEAAVLDSMRRLPWILSAVIPLILIALYMAWGQPDALTPQDYRWVNAIGWLDLGMVCWLLIVSLIIRMGHMTHRLTRWGAAPLLLLAASFLLFSGVASLIEQWGRSSVTIYMLGCVFVGALLLIRPIHAVVLFLGSYVLFFFALGAMQSNPMLLPESRLYGFSAVVLSLLLSVLLWRKHTVMVLLQREIEDQRRVLQARNEELKQQHLQLEILAQRDGLTGLFNRREFARLAEVELLRARRHGGGTAVIMVDLDFFKRVNDTYGHPAGDEVIKFVADALRAGVRGTDVVARLGGEEFIVLLPNTSMEAAIEVAEKLRASVHQASITIGPLPAIQMTASCGVTGLTQALGGSLESLYAAADFALYAAKSLGRNRVEACSVADLAQRRRLAAASGESLVLKMARTAG